MFGEVKWTHYYRFDHVLVFFIYHITHILHRFVHTFIRSFVLPSSFLISLLTSNIFNNIHLTYIIYFTFHFISALFACQSVHFETLWDPHGAKDMTARVKHSKDLHTKRKEKWTESKKPQVKSPDWRNELRFLPQNKSENKPNFHLCRMFGCFRNLIHNTMSWEFWLKLHSLWKYKIKCQEITQIIQKENTWSILKKKYVRIICQINEFGAN